MAQQWPETAPSLQMNNLLILAKKTLQKRKLNFSRGALFHMKTRVNLKYFVRDCSSLWVIMIL